MKATQFLPTLTLAVLLAGTAAARAQAAGSETIAVTIAPGQPIELFFPNVFDPFHPKHLHFVGTADSQVPGADSTLFIYFDWLDLAGGVQTSPPVQYDIVGGQPVPIDTEFWLPFCPQQVSLHLEIPNDPAFQPVFVQGVFTHVCVPEGDGLLAGLAVLGVAGGVWWRRRK